MNLISIENQYNSGVYNKQAVALVRGQGALLWDEEGHEFIDCMGGHGSANLGHAQPDVAQAIADQACRLISCPEAFPNDRRAELMARLCSLVPGLNRAFLCNSGTESVEAALKFARVSTGRTEIVAAMRGFHGRTFGALSATWNKMYREPFEPLLPGFKHIPYNNIDALEEAVDDRTAAVLLEAVQGEGGVYPADDGFLQAAQRIALERQVLLIIDEVQTGFGRTGKMFAIEHSGIQPDMLCLAKSIAGGLPMGAVLLGERVKNLAPGLHASTFGGNPLACAASLAALNVLERDHLPEQAAAKGAYLIERLHQIRSPLIREVRGKGLMVGIELKRKVAPYLQKLQSRGVIALSAGMTVIRLLPPLVITYEQLDQVIQVIQDVLHQDE